jgi:hypothetical protein
VRGKNDLVKKVLEKKAVVIVANHPFESEEVALIASLPSRSDTYLVVNSHFMGVIPSLDNYLIPVYIWHHVTREKSKKFLGILLHKFHPTPVYSPQEEHKRNIKSIDRATQIVRKGGVVIIFPGRRSIDGHWFSGVGHLLKGLGKDSDAYVVKAYVHGTRDFDYLRILPGLGRFMPPIFVSFATPTKVDDVYDEDGKKITNKLETEYDSWVKRGLHD